jgi:hypothetical protein
MYMRVCFYACKCIQIIDVYVCMCPYAFKYLVIIDVYACMQYASKRVATFLYV